MDQLLFERYLKDFRETLRENGIEKGDILYVASGNGSACLTVAIPGFFMGLLQGETL